MYGVIGEGESDAQMLKVLIRRISNNKSLAVLAIDFGGCGDILRKGAAQLRSFANTGCSKFVVCHDADGPDPQPKRRLVLERVVVPSKCENCCILIPVQEIEAWILADIDNVARYVAPSWVQLPFVGNPESEEKPKKTLERLSRQSNKRPRYAHAVDNLQIAKHINWQRVQSRCNSFRPLVEFVLRQ